MSVAELTLSRQKPLLRGVSHQVAFFVSLAATAFLVRVAPGRRGVVAATIYGASLALLYGISALYHRPNWGPAGRQRMRRLDHAAIFVLIAGSYTPLFMLLDETGTPLRMVWIGAAIGVAKSLLWPGAPKFITAALCVALGWAVIGHVARLAPVMGPLTLWLLVASGCIYTAGAIIYALRRPDPLPSVFGYHEVFHALVIVASVCHFAHALRVRELAARAG